MKEYHDDTNIFQEKSDEWKGDGGKGGKLLCEVVQGHERGISLHKEHTNGYSGGRRGRRSAG